jgi:putative alpha-1,2-mannosidase
MSRQHTFILLDPPWITHDEITSGGTLVFEMGILPNKSWCSKN